MTENQPGYPARPLPAWEAWVERFWLARRAEDRGRVLALDDAERIRQLALVAVGLPGEVGEALEHVKKHLRDGTIDEHAFGLELGDALYCLTKLALLYGFTLEDLQRLTRGKLQRRAALGKDPAGESDPDEIRAWAEQGAIDDRVREPGAPAAPAQPEGGDFLGWVHEVVWEDGTSRSLYSREPKLLGSQPGDNVPLAGLVSQRIVPAYTRPAPAQQAVTDTALGAWCRAEMQRVGAIKTVSGSDVYGIMFPAVARGAGVDAAVIAALASNAAASAADAQEQPR